ncbi:hypothetical protein [Halodesulfurarchaeum sp.]|uniref:hypothetical protein n=1 Tax=Halodesulfurarchaeum sp. TaxID=1980530 RepID=UPI002FC2A18F
MTTLTARKSDSVPPDPGSWSLASVKTGAGLIALLPMLALLAFTVGTNTPIGPRLPMGSIGAPIEAAALAGPALGALVLGLTSESSFVRVGMLFAGVFGALSLVSQSAMGPATIAIGAASVVVGLDQGRSRTGWRSLARLAVTGAFVFGIVVSMLAALGFEPALTRGLGSIAIGVAIAGTPAFTGFSRRSVFVGLLGGAIVAGIGLAAPVITAAVSLLGMGVIGLPLPLLVLGAIGGVSAVAAGLEHRDAPPALAGALVLVAGVPATIPSAISLLVALVLFTGAESR